MTTVIGLSVTFVVIGIGIFLLLANSGKNEREATLEETTDAFAEIEAGQQETAPGSATPTPESTEIRMRHPADFLNIERVASDLRNGDNLRPTVGNTASAGAGGTVAGSPGAGSGTLSAPEDLIDVPNLGFDPEVAAFIDSLTISGVLGSASQPRILLGGVVYNKNGLIDLEREIRFIGVDREKGEIIFRDGSGSLYYKAY